jgi:hypothetical protein
MRHCSRNALKRERQRRKEGKAHINGLNRPQQETSGKEIIHTIEWPWV